MLGFGDGGVALAFVATLGSAVLCVVYGLLHWDEDDTPLPAPRHPAGEHTEIDEV